jgi:hypothetical protein
MEQELFFSGYCRVLDSSRSVIAVIEDGSLTEVDCNFENCIYATSCPIGQQIQNALK